MKLGDLIRHYDADCGTGIVIDDPRRHLGWGAGTEEDVLILWSDGLTEWCDPEMIEVVK